MRRSVDVALDRLCLRKRDDVWSALWRAPVVFPHSRTMAITDLRQLTASSRLDYWAAGPSNMSYVFLIRTALDRKRLQDPEFALRLNDEKFFLFDLESAAPAPTNLAATLHEYFRSLVDRLEPDRVRSARFAPLDGLLWVEFSDGLERGLLWRELPFAAQLDFNAVSASASDHGQSILFLDEAGREIDVDAGALRALVDADHRNRLNETDTSERHLVGLRIRQLRADCGLSQEELATRSGIPQESLSRIENGRRDPRLDTLRKLAAGCGVDLQDVLSRLGRQ